MVLPYKQINNKFCFIMYTTYTTKIIIKKIKVIRLCCCRYQHFIFESLHILLLMFKYLFFNCQDIIIDGVDKKIYVYL